MKPLLAALVLMIMVLTGVCPSLHGNNLHRYANDIYYLCADWGPDLEAKDPAQADEIIYFIKLIEFRSPRPDEKGPAARLWFCKMNWDGSHKQEICELWAEQKISIGTEPDTMWMSVCPRAKKAAFSIEYGAQPSWGLFMIDLDGKNLRELARPTWTDKDKRAYAHPGISPTGEEVVFSAIQHDPKNRKEGKSRLGIVTVKTSEVRWLTEGPEDCHPDWSPKGDWIVYTHNTYLPNGKQPRRIWLVTPDGSERKAVVNVEAADKELFAWWPSWSTDGRWIYALSGNPWFYIVDAANGKVASHQSAGFEVGMAKLGRKGILNGGLGISLILAKPPEFQGAKLLSLGPRATVPSEHYGDLSTYDLKWGERPGK